jgi:uncharacterized protein
LRKPLSHLSVFPKREVFMNRPTLNDALDGGELNQSEIDRLSNHLAAIGPPALSLEAVDGLFTALICGPDMVMFSEYLPVVFGGDPAFSGNAQASEILGLLLRHWNVVADALLRTLNVPDVYSPLLQTGSDGTVKGNDWACGFMHGVGMRERSWQPMMAGGEHGGVLLPMVILKHEVDSTVAPGERFSITPDRRKDLIETMIAVVPTIYAHFAKGRATGGSNFGIAAHAAMSGIKIQPPRRTSVKVGRNEPCPCGSGRKFKVCCSGKSEVH